MLRNSSRLLALVLAAVSTPVEATEIIFVHYPGGFAVGADSLRLQQSDDPNVQSSGLRVHVCKLRVSSDMVLATYGSAGWYELTPDLRQISDELLRSPGGDAQKKNKDLGDALVRDKRFLARLNKADPPTAGWVFIQRFGAFEGQLDIAGGSADVRLYEAEDDALGFIPHTLPALMKMQPSIVRTRDGAVDAVREILEVGARHDEAKIGKPFSILTVDSSGTRWVEKGACLSGGLK